MINPRCHVGETHGIYTLVDVLDEKDKYGHWIYKGICNVCGREKCSHYGDFSGPKSMTTVCTHIGINGWYIELTKWENKRIGDIFRGMKARCYNKNDKNYKHYGKKGICICDEWMNNPKSFEKWSMGNGYADNLTIDRIDGSKNYCPENCRWVTLVENTINKPTTNMINVDGEVHTGRGWSRKLGLGENQINKYIKKNGVENVTEFIRRYLDNPTLQPKNKQSYYDLYMNNNTMSV